MIDTVKLLIKIHNPSRLDGNKFSPVSIEQLVNSRSYGKTSLNPSASYNRMGKYMPRLTFFKRPSKYGAVYQLAVEFSAPKMLFLNNFDELVESDFEELLTILQDKIQELLGFKFLKQVLAKSDVGTWHPSKNIVFIDFTSCQMILNIISKLDISHVYDLQKTDFRDGHVVHIHCNSMDIAFYDKMADLRKSKTSPKRAIEKDSTLQLNLLALLEEYRPIDVFRYEVRLVGKASIKRAFPELKEWTFENLFKKQLCQNILIKHWEKVTSSINLLSLDTKEPIELLQNYLIDNPEVGPQAALAAIASLLIIRQDGVTTLRGTLDSHFGKQVWHRLKKTIKSPSENRFKSFIHIDEALERFEPTKMSKFINNIDNNVK